jgi:hypothetical protein
MTGRTAGQLGVNYPWTLEKRAFILPIFFLTGRVNIDFLGLQGRTQDHEQKQGEKLSHVDTPGLCQPQFGLDGVFSIRYAIKEPVALESLHLLRKGIVEPMVKTVFN